MSGIKAVIFDLGRVLVDIDLKRGLLGRLARSGVDVDSAINEFRTHPLLEKSMTGSISNEEFHTECCEQLGLDMGYGEFSDLWCDIFNPKLEMETLFRETESRVRVGICSDTDAFHWPFLRERMDILRMVDIPTLSYEVGVCKPDRRIFAQAAKNVGCAREECFFTDDLPSNIEGARAAGLNAELFTGERDLRNILYDFGILTRPGVADAV